MESATTPVSSPLTNAWLLMRMLLVFALVFFGLQWGYQAARGSALEHLLINQATVKPSVLVINWLAPSEQVRAQGPQLVSDDARLSVLNGCEGTESWFLIIAAVLAYGCQWRHKIIGLLGGSLLIYSLNQGRIIALYFALRQDQTLFTALHGYLAPTLIIALGSIFFIGWAQWSMRTKPS